MPSTAYDAKGLMKSAIRDNDPVLFMENTLLYGETGEVPDGEYLVPLGKANILREGTDLSIIGHGRAIQMALISASVLKEKHNINAEVVDLRSIRPLDIDTVLASVARTHRVLIVEEQKPFASVGSQLAYMIQREAFDEAAFEPARGVEHEVDAREQALLHAARVRLRPILMTTLAMVFGMVPLAFALTEGSEQRAPMGQAVIGGVVTSSLLTLVVVPVIYCYLDDLAAWAKRRVRSVPAAAQ